MAEMAEKDEEELAKHLGWKQDWRKVVFVPKEERQPQILT
jgi:hypothetical protein